MPALPIAAEEGGAGGARGGGGVAGEVPPGRGAIHRHEARSAHDPYGEIAPPGLGSLLMIRSISVEGFKSIASLELELGRVNCFIGANGVGKSNVLEAIGVLGAAANGRVDDEALQRRGVRPGLPRLYKTAFADLQIRPHITLEATSSSGALYRVALLNPLEGELAWGFKTEKLSGEDGDLVSRGVRTDKTNLDPTAGLSALKAV
jgi:hypothetical protein